MADVLITPASGKIDFKDSGGNVDATIQLDGSGNLAITNPGGDISIGDTTGDIYIGDGVNNVDLVFEQNGEIRGTGSQTITLGQSGDTIKIASGATFEFQDGTTQSTAASGGGSTGLIMFSWLSQ